GGDKVRRGGNSVALFFRKKLIPKKRKKQRRKGMFLVNCRRLGTKLVSAEGKLFTGGERAVAPRTLPCLAWRRRCCPRKPSRCTTFLTCATSSRSDVCSKTSAQPS